MTAERVRFTSSDARFLLDHFGFSLFPVHGITDDMQCTCGDQKCTNKGKHPATPNGCNDSSGDINGVLSLWHGRKGLNVGIATGKKSNCFVIDIDGPQAEKDLEYLTSIHGEIPLTLQQSTGRGRHIFFKYPDNCEHIKTRKAVIGEKIDVRGDGGYVVGYKSTHSSGAVYNFINPLDDIADCPKWLLDIVLADKQSEKKSNIYPIDQHKKSNIFSTNEWSKEQIVELLSYINPDIGYDEWYQIGMAIKDYGLPFSVWDDWSKRGSKYNQHEMAGKWNSFNGNGISIGSLIYHAKNGGWRPAVISDYIERQISKNESFDPQTGEIKQEIEPKKNKFHYINAPDIDTDLDVNDFVQGLLTENAMSVVYGESNCGKTFFMSDLAFHVAQGKEWRGKRVEKGNVLYLSLEGSRGIKNRISAYKLENKVDLDGFLMMPCQVDFIKSEEDIPELVELVASANSVFDHKIKLIVVDTLARAIGGGDENSGVDMGALVKHSDIIREHTNAHICFIHHSGKDKARGARGHSSLRAAVDTEIEISRNEGDDFSNIKIAKQRDLEKDDDLQFKLKRIVLGVNRHNEEVSSCVVEPYNLSEDVNSRIEKKIKSGKTKTAFDALRECIMEKGFIGSGQNMPNCKVVTVDAYKQYLIKRAVMSDNPTSHRKQWERISGELIENKIAVIRDNFIWPSDDIIII